MVCGSKEISKINSLYLSASIGTEYGNKMVNISTRATFYTWINYVSKGLWTFNKYFLGMGVERRLMPHFLSYWVELAPLKNCILYTFKYSPMELDVAFLGGSYTLRKYTNKTGYI